MAFPHVFATLGGNVPASFLDDNFNACLTVAGQPGLSVLGNNTSGTGNAVPLSPSQLYAMLRPVLPWETAAFMGGTQGGANWFILRYQPSTNVIINQGSCYASAGTGATAAATFNILDSGVTIGTVTFAIGALTGSVSITTNPYTLIQGHILSIQGPTTPDTTLADVNVTLGGNRS